MRCERPEREGEGECEVGITVFLLQQVVVVAVVVVARFFTVILGRPAPAR